MRLSLLRYCHYLYIDQINLQQFQIQELQINNMDTLTLLWIFDKRWIGFTSCLQENTLLIPIAYHLTQIALLIFANNQKCHNNPQSYAIGVLLLMLIIAQLVILWTVKMRVQEKERQFSYCPNGPKICVFMREYEFKKMVWGWPLLLVASLELMLTFGQSSMLAHRICDNPCQRAFYYINIASWCYIGIILAAFLLIKICYIVPAWCCPRCFLKFGINQ